MKPTTSLLLSAVLLCACSAAPDNDDYVGPSNPRPKSSSTKDAGTSGAAGSSSLKTSPSGSGGTTQPAPCQAVSQTAEKTIRPSDIIIVVDQSTSMGDETKWVQKQLNGFSSLILNAGIDVRVVLIVEKPGGPVGEHPICVPPPLAGPNCSDNPPVFTHVSQHVGSSDALQQVVQQFEKYKDVLRPGAKQHVVAISDDQSVLPADQFDAKLRALDPQLFTDYTFHAIVAVSHCDEAEKTGTEYIELVKMTGGVLGDLCKQNFQPVWTAVSQLVVEGGTLSCQWLIPSPPQGQQLDPKRVNVVYTNQGDPTQLEHVQTGSDCNSSQGGWYYDNPTKPTKVILCPEVCTALQQAGEEQKIDIQFGCATKESVPK